jgi:hypothetical protein
VRAEAERARAFYKALKADEHLQLVVSGDGNGSPGSEEALKTLFRTCNIRAGLVRPELAPGNSRGDLNASERMHRQVNELVMHTQVILRESPKRRSEFWSQADASSPVLPRLHLERSYRPIAFAKLGS